MAEDFDVEAMLEAPYNSTKDSTLSMNGNSNHEKSRDGDRDKKRRSRSRSGSRGKSDKDKERDRERERRKRSRSKERRRSRERRSRRSRSTSRSKRRSSKSRERKRRSRSRDRFRRRSPIRWGDRFVERKRFERSRSRSPHRREDLPAEERDQRTIFCMQLSAKVRPRDLEDFFCSVGKVREVRLIIDAKTRRHKGIAYVEFYDISSVPLALALNGQKLCGHPISIQPTQAEKNRAAAAAAASSTTNPTTKGSSGPMRLYVGSLHFNITEDMLKGIFEPFGKIEKIELQRDPETMRSKGYGFITFYDAEDAKKALEQLNGFELAGRQMKVNHVTERTDIVIQGPSILDSDELDRTGIDLGTTGRLQLMAKLAEGTGIELPQAAVNALQMNKSASTAATATTNNNQGPPIATQCFTLTNMFDPTSETNPTWDEEIRNDVIDECRIHGGALHVYVDRNSMGNVYVKCPSISTSTACVNALHGRWFSGRVVTAAYVPVITYHNLFPDSVNVTTTL